MPADLDLVVFGATGFTGELVATYLAGAAPAGLRWGLAGRDLAKLEAVRGRIAQVHPGAAELPLIVADSHDRASLDALVARTRVVCTTVGPYLKHGIDLVEACADAGVSYCDLTGEVPFMQRTIAACHERAQQTGARIVHTCGYDSIPSDLGTFVLQTFLADAGLEAPQTTTVVGPSRGGASGGTIASLFAVVEAAGDRDARRAMAHPYALDPVDDRGSADTWDRFAPAACAPLGVATAPFFMAPVNTRVVRRSHALLGRPWGEDFTYDEVMATGRGLKGTARAWGITTALGAFMGAAATPTLRGLLGRWLPSPGEGPDADAREAGYFRHLVVAQDAAGVPKAYARVGGDLDPGYGFTAVMLGQSALCLAVDAPQLPDVAGVLTPSVAMGDVLVERLRAAGMTLTVDSWPSDGVPGFFAAT